MPKLSSMFTIEWLKCFFENVFKIGFEKYFLKYKFYILKYMLWN